MAVMSTEVCINTLRQGTWLLEAFENQGERTNQPGWPKGKEQRVKEGGRGLTGAVIVV